MWSMEFSACKAIFIWYIYSLQAVMIPHLNCLIFDACNTLKYSIWNVGEGNIINVKIILNHKNVYRQIWSDQYLNYIYLITYYLTVWNPSSRIFLEPAFQSDMYITDSLQYDRWKVKTMCGMQEIFQRYGTHRGCS